MATSYIFVPGFIKWAKGLAEADKEYNTYNAQLVVTAEERDRLEAAGCQATFKKDDQGYVFKIKSSTTRPIKDRVTGLTKDVEASPPDVFLVSPDSGKHVSLDPKTVGNGSEVLVKLELYDTRKGGKGTRLVAVRVDNYIEYKPDNVVGGEDMPF